MDVDALPDPLPLASSSALTLDVDQKPDLPALAAGERRAEESTTRRTHDGKRILREIPVYFTSELADHLTLLQYPHRWRQSHMNSEDLPLVPKSQQKRPVQARIKPLLNTLELSVPIEGPGHASYSRVKGSEMGRGVESSDLGGPPPVPGRRKSNPEEARPLERITFRAEALADQTNYCAGLLTDDGLHLTPLLNTMQLRASLTYLDRNKARERERRARGGGDDDAEHTASEDSDEEDHEDEFQAKKKKLTNQEEKKPEAKTLTVSLRQDANSTSAGDKGVGRSTAALFAPHRADAIEPWTPLAFFGQRTDEANIVAQGLMCRSPETKLTVQTRTSEQLSDGFLS